MSMSYEPHAGLEHTAKSEQALWNAAYWAVEESVRRIREDLARVVASLGAARELTDKVRLAASEGALCALSVALGKDARLLHVRALQRGRELHVTIACEADGTDQPDDPDLELRMLLMLACSDGLALERAGGMRVALRFELLDARGDDAAQVA